MHAASPFRVADVATNAILLRAEQDLHALAERFGTAAERDEIAARIARRHDAILRLWDAALGVFVGFDLVAEAPIRVGTSAGFLPLFAGATTSAHTNALAVTFARWAAAVAWVIPSTDPAASSFEPMRYWRGPIWSVVNWMIAEGFAAHGQDRGDRARSHVPPDRDRGAGGVFRPHHRGRARRRGFLVDVGDLPDARLIRSSRRS